MFRYSSSNCSLLRSHDNIDYVSTREDSKLIEEVHMDQDLLSEAREISGHPRTVLFHLKDPQAGRACEYLVPVKEEKILYRYSYGTVLTGIAIFMSPRARSFPSFVRMETRIMTIALTLSRLTATNHNNGE